MSSLSNTGVKFMVPSSPLTRSRSNTFGATFKITERAMRYQGQQPPTLPVSRRFGSMTSPGFANTDLDLQLKKRGIHKLIVIGQKANTCIDSTVRYAVELGYDVTLVKDAIASYKWEEMQATLEVNLPNYASAIISTSDTIAALNYTQSSN